MNRHFVGAVKYADDITLLGATRISVIALLDVCSNYAHDHGIIFNPSKTTCVFQVMKVVFQENNYLL